MLIYARQFFKRIATADSCFDLLRSRQHGVTSCEVISWSTDIDKPTKQLSKCQKCQMYVYSGHAVSYTKLVYRHATQTEGNKYFK